MQEFINELHFMKGIITFCLFKYVARHNLCAPQSCILDTTVVFYYSVDLLLTYAILTKLCDLFQWLAQL